jgi:acyl-coenzyme A synthetase/AMP-(fatty) acid ligase
MGTVPLIDGFGAGSVFAYRDGRAVGADEFLGNVAQLAAVLPDRDHVLNLCADRYRFAVGFAAALVRQQISLLPPNQTPHLIAQLLADYGDVYCLIDGGAPPVALETVLFPEAVASARGALPVPVVSDRQIAVIVFTSGSTGRPVPHAKTWGGLARGARMEIDRLSAHVCPGMSVLSTVPPQHMYGLESTVVMPMQGGLALHAGRPFYPADVRNELAALPRPRALVTTPVHLRVLLADDETLPAADLLLCATAPLSPQLAAAAERRFSAPLHEIYGCTEAGQIATRRTVATAEWVVLPGVVLQMEADGVRVGGPHMEGDALLGDVVELWGEGRFLLHGRTADMVNVAGKRTSLAHLNYHLNSIEGVRDGAFVMPEQNGDGVPRLMAFVVAPGLTSENVMRALRERVDAAFLPRPLCFVEALPRNATGKLPREAVDELLTGLDLKVE